MHDLMTRWERRRQEIARKSDEELRAIATMECVVPLDFDMAAMADEELARRATPSEESPESPATARSQGTDS